MPFGIPINDGTCGDHFSVHNHIWVKQTGKEAIVFGGPIHHRRDTDSWLKFIFNGGQISHSKLRLNEMEEEGMNKSPKDYFFCPKPLRQHRKERVLNTSIKSAEQPGELESSQ